MRIWNILCLRSYFSFIAWIKQWNNFRMFLFNSHLWPLLSGGKSDYLSEKSLSRNWVQKQSVNISEKSAQIGGYIFCEKFRVSLNPFLREINIKTTKCIFFKRAVRVHSQYLSRENKSFSVIKLESKKIPIS